jgi:hypothetical protein
MHLFEEPMAGMAPDVALDVRAGARAADAGDVATPGTDG